MIDDGSLDEQSRALALQNFRMHQGIAVLLMSLMCGSLGLNLTIASRVIMVDLWWNPSVEGIHCNLNY